jgi:hypothetical protein
VLSLLDEREPLFSHDTKLCCGCDDRPNKDEAGRMAWQVDTKGMGSTSIPIAWAM